MIQEVQPFEKYEGFICDLSEDLLYSDPHFTNNNNNLYNAVKDADYLKHLNKIGKTGIFRIN